MASKYHFITRIQLEAPRQEVWDVLEESESWSDWWRWLLHVEVLDEGDEDGVGREVRNRVATPLLYRLTYDGRVTRLIEPSLIEFQASRDLVGTGQFQLHDLDPAGTELEFNWLVETPQWWMNLLVPVARPLFSWNHDRLMTDFAKGLAATTHSTLIDVANQTLAPREQGFYELPTW